MVDLGQNVPYNEGENVYIYGGNDKQFIHIDEVAGTLRTIGYEVTCNVSKRVSRIHVST